MVCVFVGLGLEEGDGEIVLSPCISLITRVFVCLGLGTSTRLLGTVIEMGDVDVDVDMDSLCLALGLGLGFGRLWIRSFTGGDDSDSAFECDSDDEDKSTDRAFAGCRFFIFETTGHVVVESNILGVMVGSRSSDTIRCVRRP